ncbi:TPA: 2-oxoglutarate:acceptor oxidoreductase, partial [Campylobacter jejuni]|nr:2-oxoglutarate:acceptor oxidoreductase [Campylobacter jejuni]
KLTAEAKDRAVAVKNNKYKKLA